MRSSGNFVEVAVCSTIPPNAWLPLFVCWVDMFVGSMDCHTLQRVLASHSQLFFQSLTLKQLKQCAYRVYRLPSGEFRFFVRDTHGNKHGLQSNHFNAYRTDFSVSKNSPHKTVLLCLLMSIRWTYNFFCPHSTPCPTYQRERHEPRFDMPSLSP